MLSRIEVFFRKFKRLLSRSEWTIHLLRLSKLNQPTSEPGLVMVQIDGLSMTQFNRGLKKRNLPFLQSLLSKEHYTLHSFYSGLPSNTPAVQAELFYGIKGCVPSFSFVDRKTGRKVKMMDTGFVEEFENRLKAKGPGLLAGGSSYSNIYTGSAKESHCCWSRMGWDGVLWAVNPFVFPFLVILYADIFIRTIILVVIEFFLALFECMRGTLKGKLFFRELELVWLRSLVCVVLREFITAGVCMDIMRGVPVIHLNFLGYDEQAHGRGPSSAFAHWSLRGIDDAIKRIYNVIKQSPHRHYDLWVYSDHGQAKTTPYFVKYGRTVEEAIQELFGNAIAEDENDYLQGQRQFIKGRASLLYQRKNRPSATDTNTPSDNSIQEQVIVMAMGPLGQIYVKKPLSVEKIDFYANKLVSQIKIPLVLAKEAGKVIAWTPRGRFVFPDEAAKIFGAEHPFLEEIKEDLLRVCDHPDAGEFIIAGWSDGQEAISFPLEYGAHASMGPEETHAFALLPIDAPIKIQGKTYLRPIDLRQTAQHFLNKETMGRLFIHDHDLSSKPLRLMSYNIHGCVGMDGHISTERIARVIARYNPDIIALQELDVGRLRSGRMDQTDLIARKLEMKYHFNPAFRWKDEQYGNAILSRYPMALIKSGSLPKVAGNGKSEDRGALWVSIEFEGKKIHVFNTHLSLWPKERVLQAEALLSEEWLQHPDCQGPVILCGDFNALPRSAVYRRISKRLHDSQTALAGHRPRSTWFGHYPISRIDYVFIDDSFHVHSILVPRTDLDKIASDHLPLITELDFVNS